MSTIDEQMVLAHFIVSDDVERSRRFYTDVLGGKPPRPHAGPAGYHLTAAPKRLLLSRDERVSERELGSRSHRTVGVA
jgi:catechol 2,3-dioxygenase-like lactoylglutathione lyase family enzyme